MWYLNPIILNLHQVSPVWLKAFPITNFQLSRVIFKFVVLWKLLCNDATWKCSDLKAYDNFWWKKWDPTHLMGRSTSWHWIEETTRFCLPSWDTHPSHSMYPNSSMTILIDVFLSSQNFLQFHTPLELMVGSSIVAKSRPKMLSFQVYRSQLKSYNSRSVF